MVSTELAPGATSNCRDAVRAVPVAVSAMQPTSAGTIVIATRTEPTSSCEPREPQPACSAAASRATAAPKRTSVQRNGEFIRASLCQRAAPDTGAHAPETDARPLHPLLARFFGGPRQAAGPVSAR